MTFRPLAIYPSVLAPAASPEENLVPEGAHSLQLLVSMARHEHEIAAELSSVITMIYEMLAEQEKPS